MHSVEYYELIRRKHFVDGMSLRAIAKELGHSRKFVKKAISHAIPPGYRLSEPKPRPVLNPLRPRVLSLLQVGSSAQHAPRREVHVWPLKL